jgi:hypothetical protein
MAGPDLILDEIYPMLIMSSFHQEEKIVIFPMGQEQLGAMLGSCARIFPDLK